VLLAEIVTLGEIPYPEYTNMQVSLLLVTASKLFALIANQIPTWQWDSISG